MIEKKILKQETMNVMYRTVEPAQCYLLMLAQYARLILSSQMMAAAVAGLLSLNSLVVLTIQLIIG
jgi:hypothetical protein